MNRAEKRHPNKPSKIRQMIEDISVITKLKKAIEDGWQFNPGDKVQLNMDAITSHPGYNERGTSYRKFCEENAGRIFTVEYNGDMNPSVVCLAEDTTNPKWLFWTGDLMAVTENP